jgi:phosphoglycolate phosphatase
MMSEMQNTHLLLFDIDLTLIRTGGTGRAALEQTFREMTGVDSPGIIRPDGRTDPEIIKQMYKSAGVLLQLTDLRLFCSRYVENLREATRARGGGEVLPGVTSLLEHLADRPDVRLALLTGNLRESAKVKLEAVQLWHYFPVGGFASDAEERTAIAALAYEAAAAHYGFPFPAAHTIVIGDSVWDIRAALGNGFRCIAVATGLTSVEELRAEGPDAVLLSLEDQERFIEIAGLSQAALLPQGG